MRGRDRFVAGICAVLVAATASGCGSSAPKRRPPPTVHVPKLSPAPPDRIRQPTGPPVGTTQHVDSEGAKLAVTITQVIDPLRSSGASLQPGTRAIGVLVRIANFGPATYDSSATGDFSLVPSSGDVTPVFVPSGVCQTPVNDFDSDIGGGGVRIGCVAFAIAAPARLLAVRFSPHAAAPGRLTWVIAR